jgi:hypothetical protein
VGRRKYTFVKSYPPAIIVHSATHILNRTICTSQTLFGFSFMEIINQNFNTYIYTVFLQIPSPNPKNQTYFVFYALSTSHLILRLTTILKFQRLKYFKSVQILTLAFNTHCVRLLVMVKHNTEIQLYRHLWTSCTESCLPRGKREYHIAQSRQNYLLHNRSHHSSLFNCIQSLYLKAVAVHSSRTLTNRLHNVIFHMIAFFIFTTLENLWYCPQTLFNILTLQ